MYFAVITVALALGVAHSAPIACIVPEFKSGAAHDVVIRCDVPTSMKTATTLQIQITGLLSYEVQATVWVSVVSAHASALLI
jgi:hypothetical protein